jgi:hypothetical protein
MSASHRKRPDCFAHAKRRDGPTADNYVSSVGRFRIETRLRFPPVRPCLQDSAGAKALQMLVEGFDVFGAHIQYWRPLAILAAAVAIVIFCSGTIGLGHSRWRDRPFGEIDRSDHQFRPATAISGTPCFHLSQWATTSLMKGADAAHRLLMAGTKPPDPPSGPQPHRECQADSPG